MKKSKLNLDQLKVKSFCTDLSVNKSKTIIGGASVKKVCPSNGPISECSACA